MRGGDSQRLRWQLGKSLGQGAFAEVFHGINTETGKFLAVKQIKLKIEGCAAAKALRREIEMMIHMPSHRNIVKYLGTEQTKDRLFIFLEYISGGSIADMLEKFGALDENIVARYTHDLLCGLDFLHAKSIVHCDIKGANLLVSEDGVVKLADFNSSKLLVDIPLSGAQRDLRSIAGTPQVFHKCTYTQTDTLSHDLNAHADAGGCGPPCVQFMAPEVAQQTGQGVKSDIWSVGCTVIQMLTASPPWNDSTNALAIIFRIGSAKGPPEFPPGISAACAQFLSLCFKLKAEDRPSCQQLLQLAFVGGGGSEEGGVVSIGAAAHRGLHSKKRNHQVQNRINTRGGQSAGTKAWEEGDAESDLGSPETKRARAGAGTGETETPRPVEPLQPVANFPAAADDVSEEDEDDVQGEASEAEDEDEDEDEDEECDSAELQWFKDLCSQTCSKCLRQDGSKTRSLPLPEDDRRCFCSPSCPSKRFPFHCWEGILNHVPLQDLKETVKKMDGQRYWNGEKEVTFSFSDIEEVLNDFLDVRKWQWRKPLSPREGQEIQGLINTLGNEKMAAIRAWTADDIDLQRCVASVSRKATSKECLQKILPYIRLLYDGLCLLPETRGDQFTAHVFADGEIYRGEKGIRASFRKCLEPEALIDDLVHFTSFTTEPSVAANFKLSPELFLDEDTELVTANAEFTLTERLHAYFGRYACDECEVDFCERAGGIAVLFEKRGVAKLQKILEKRFPGKELPRKDEKPLRTIICVQNGVGYRLGILSVVPEEHEVLLEPLARLQVIEDSRTDWAIFGEDDSKRLKLKTVMSGGLSALTVKDGQPFTSPAKNKEREACTKREVCAEVQELLASLSGPALSDKAAQIRRMLLEDGSAVTRKGASTQTQRSVTRGGQASSDKRGLAVNEEQKVQALVQQLREEVHDFDGACDWLLQVTVKQHDGKYEEDGKRIDSSKVQTAKNYRLYTVDAGQELRVYLRNLSLVKTISFTPVYVNEEGTEEIEEERMLKSGEAQELPFPLKKEDGEREESWILKDERGKTLLRLRFHL
jgi:serine/threonine protein kinase